jgi:glycosyltransferase involved in cell wall biosynthesis
LKIYHFNYASNQGGAARAAHRIHQALLEIDLESKLFVNKLDMQSTNVFGPSGAIEKGVVQMRPKIADSILKLLRTGNSVKHSVALFSSRWLNFINNSDADIIHLHWINREMLSISDIGRIKKPVVWTLHDMWPFCGAEHLSHDHRWETGYGNLNRPDHEHGLDLNRWVFNRKVRHWKTPMQIVTPSNWLTQCAGSSYLMHKWSISTIPNCLDTEVWKPANKKAARDLLGLPQDVPIVLFGSYGANNSYNKGFDLLKEAIKELQDRSMEFHLAVFGNASQNDLSIFEFPVHYFGHLHDDISLRALYSAADALIIPSRQEAFGQVASEAQACGTAVVAFATTGLNDVVEHKKTGYLAKPFNVNDLAVGIIWSVASDNQEKLSRNAVIKSRASFSSKTVAKQYKTLYKKVYNDSGLGRL